MAVLLSTFLYGIVGFGVLLSAKQTITQAAADGARAAVSAPQTPDEATNPDSPVRTVARSQAANAASWLHTPAGVPAGGLSCPEAGGATAAQPLTCTTSVAPCTGNVTQQCLTLTVSYAYAAKPVIPSLPIVGNLMPQQLTSTSTIQLDGGLVQ